MGDVINELKKESIFYGDKCKCLVMEPSRESRTQEERQRRKKRQKEKKAFGDLSQF